MTNRPIQIQKNRTSMMKKKVQTPFIGLTPIPTLLIDRVNVDFQMEVTSTETDKSNISSDISTKISKEWFEKAEINGKMGTQEYLLEQPNAQVPGSRVGQPTSTDQGFINTDEIMTSYMDPKQKQYNSSKEDKEKAGNRCI